MPWDHCGATIPDTVPCPACGVTKQQWTTEWNTTRTFQIKRRPLLRVVVQDGDQPRPDVVVRVVRPDGSTAEVATDELGMSKVECAGPGTCQVSFVGREPGTVSAVTEDVVAAGPGTWSCTVGKRYVFTLGGRQAWMRLLDRVRVREDGSHLPLAGRRYTLTGPGDARLEGTTDAEGELRHLGVAAGDWSLALTDLPDLAVPAIALPSDTTRPQTRLLPSGRGQLWLRVLERNERDADGRFVPLTNLRLVLEEPASEAVLEELTDDAGEVRVEDLPWGDWTVRLAGAERPRRAAIVLPHDAGRPQALLLDLPAPPAPPPRGVSVWLRLLDRTRARADGVHVPLAGLAYTLTGPDDARLEGTTDTEGELRHDALARGDWSLALTDLLDLAVPVVALAAGATRPQTRLLPGGRGQVWLRFHERNERDADGRLVPLTNLRVVLEEAASEAVLEELTDEAGEVRVEDLPWGDWTVRVAGSARATAAIVLPAEAERPQVLLLDLPGPPPPPRRTGVLWLRLLDRERAALAGRSYTLTSSAGARLGGTTDAAGDARHDDVPFGDWRLTLDGLPAVAAIVCALPPPAPQVCLLGARARARRRSR